MNITCDQCKKRYILPDERVPTGSTKRVRCRNCQHLIVVRREADASPAEAPARPSPSAALDEAREWFVLIRGAQVGPLRLAELRQKVSAGEVTARTHFWQPGMAEWQRGEALPGLSALWASQAPKQPAVRASPPARAQAQESESGLDGAQLFSGASDVRSEPSGSLEDTPLERSVSGKERIKHDPFAAVAALSDTSVSAPPGEQTRMFIAQAGVNKRNPPWKIALFAVVAVGLPTAVLAALSTMGAIPAIKTVNAQGVEVQQPFFSAGGFGALRDKLTGAEQARREEAEAVKAERVRARPRKEFNPLEEPVRRDSSVGAVETITLGGVARGDIKKLYEENAKADVTVRHTLAAEKPVIDRAGSGGGLADEVVAKTVGQSMKAFETCVETALKKNPNLRVKKLLVTVTVGSSGSVSAAAVDPPEHASSTLGECLVLRARRLMFPANEGGETVVEIPLKVGVSM